MVRISMAGDYHEHALVLRCAFHAFDARTEAGFPYPFLAAARCWRRKKQRFMHPPALGMQLARQRPLPSSLATLETYGPYAVMLTLSPWRALVRGAGAFWIITTASEGFGSSARCVDRR